MKPFTNELIHQLVLKHEIDRNVLRSIMVTYGFISDNKKTIEKLKALLVGVLYDPPEELREAAERANIHDKALKALQFDTMFIAPGSIEGCESEIEVYSKAFKDTRDFFLSNYRYKYRMVEEKTYVSTRILYYIHKQMLKHEDLRKALRFMIDVSIVGRTYMNKKENKT